MRMPPYVFIMPDGSVLTVHCFPDSAASLAAELGAITHGPAHTREVLLEALYGSLGCQVCIVDVHFDRPPNRLPSRMG
jgi:hypothetical protein